MLVFVCCSGACSPSFSVAAGFHIWAAHNTVKSLRKGWKGWKGLFTPQRMCWTGEIRPHIVPEATSYARLKVRPIHKGRSVDTCLLHLLYGVLPMLPTHPPLAPENHNPIEGIPWNSTCARSLALWPAFPMAHCLVSSAFWWQQRQLRTGLGWARWACVCKTGIPGQSFLFSFVCTYSACLGWWDHSSFCV